MGKSYKGEYGFKYKQQNDFYKKRKMKNKLQKQQNKDKIKNNNFIDFTILN